MKTKRRNITARAAILLIVCAFGNLFVSAQTPAAPQQTQEELTAAADKAFEAALKLVDENTIESLKAAVENFENAAIYFELASNRNGVAFSFAGLGNVYSSLDEKGKAIDAYKAALSFFQDNTEEKALVQNNLGSLYSGLGDDETAFDYYVKALRIARAAGNKKFEADISYNIGNVFDNLSFEKQSKALSYLQHSLALNRLIANNYEEAITKSRIGWIYAKAGDKNQAKKFLGSVLNLWC